MKNCLKGFGHVKFFEKLIIDCWAIASMEVKLAFEKLQIAAQIRKIKYQFDYENKD